MANEETLEYIKKTLEHKKEFLSGRLKFIMSFKEEEKLQSNKCEFPKHREKRALSMDKEVARKSSHERAMTKLLSKRYGMFYCKSPTKTSNDSGEEKSFNISDMKREEIVLPGIGKLSRTHAKINAKSLLTPNGRFSPVKYQLRKQATTLTTPSRTSQNHYQIAETSNKFSIRLNKLV